MTNSLTFHIAVAYEANQGIGIHNNIPWKLSSELKWFRQLTTEKFRAPNDPANAVIMGANTWRSLPNKFKPLPDRLNIILSTKMQTKDINSPEVKICNSFDQALETAHQFSKNIFVIGGEMVYRAALAHPGLESVFATEIENHYQADSYFPEFKSQFPNKKVILSQEENGIRFHACQFFRNS